MALTHEDILVERWAYEYDDMLREGKGIVEESEDADFDLDAVLCQVESEGDEFETLIDDKGASEMQR